MWRAACLTLPALLFGEPLVRTPPDNCDIVLRYHLWRLRCFASALGNRWAGEADALNANVAA